MKYRIYWKEQCDFCLNRENCEYKEKVKQHMQKIDSLDSKGIYGTTSFWCDYYNLDEDAYWKNPIGECNVSI